MKKTSFLVLFLSMIINFSFAQDKKSSAMKSSPMTYEIKMEDRAMSKGQQNAYTVMLASSNKKDVEKAWSKYMKEYKGKTKKQKKTNEYLTDNAQISTMSDNTVDVYAQLQELGNETQMSVWFDLGGAFVNAETHPEASATANNILTGFARSIQKKNIEEQLKVEEKAEKKIGDELKKNEKELKNLEKDIENYKKKIKEAEAQIVANKEAKIEIESRMATQKEKVGEVKTKLKEM